MKKRIVSIFLVISVIASLFAVTAVSSSAAAKPATPVVKIHNGGSANGLYVTWNNISPRATYQVAYRRIGATGYTYTNTNKTNITLTNLKSGVGYQVQVRANINGIYGNYSKTKSMTFLSRPLIRDSVDARDYLLISWTKIPGANCYELVKWNVAKRKWDTVYFGNSASFRDGSARAGESYRYQLRAKYKTEKNGTACSAWSNVDYAVYYPKITFSGTKKHWILPEWMRIANGEKRFEYEAKWSVAKQSSSTKFEIRFCKDINTKKNIKTVKTTGNKYLFYSDDEFNYMSVRYINAVGQPVGNGTWVALKTHS